MDKTREKIIVGSPSYLIFFDSVRVDQYVKSFSVDLSCDGAIGSATVELLFSPYFYSSKVELANGFLSYGDGIENMTNCKIFIKNMFTDKYIMVFDGDIKGKSLSKSQGSYTINFTAHDHLIWLNKTIVPLAIPLDSALSSGDKLRWKAEGINPLDPNIPQLTNLNESQFKGKSLKEVVSQVVKQTITTNKIYTSPDSVSAWDNAVDRMVVMGDIDPNLREQRVLDFVVQSNTTQVSSIYVMINDLIKTLLFEFYQDRDGTIRIKPPFWNERLLKDHIVDPSLVLNYTENVDWNSYFTRIITVGGLEEQEENYTSQAKAIVTPVVAYALNSGGGMHTDFLSDGGGSTAYNTSGWPSVIRKGYSGDAVSELQSILNSLGYDCGTVDGMFGSNTEVGVKAFQSAKGLDADGIVGPLTRAALSKGGGGSTSVGNDAFLEPTDIEKRYGVTVYEASQPLIKFSNSQIITDGSNKSACEALRLYSKFMLSLLNSAVCVASMQTVAMPWIRPGFNLWVDPMTIDKVFYVSALSHQGTAEGGVYTTYRLSMGRTSYEYCSNVNAFGSVKSNKDNVFINQIFPEYAPSSFGATLGTLDEFTGVKSMFNTFYSSNEDEMIHANKSTHFSALYGNISKSSVTKSTTTTSTTGGYNHNIDSWSGLLLRGNSGSNVKELQKILNHLEYTEAGSADGIFGPKTESAVKHFQGDAGIGVDGIVGPITKKALKEALAPKTTTSTTTEQVSGGSLNGQHTYTEIQNELNSMYNSAPNVVKSRIGRLKNIITESEKYIKTHYITEG